MTMHSVNIISQNVPVETIPYFEGVIIRQIGQDESWAEIQWSGGASRVRIALGCIVRPQSGDTVLVYRAYDEDYIVQVLRRDKGGAARVAIPGRGALAIEAENLTLTGRRRLFLKGDRLDLHGRSLALVAETTTWLGKVLTGVVDRFRLSTRSHETSAETLVEKAGERTAIVDGIDSVRAETRVVTVTGVASETAQSKVIAVTDDLRMDGKRITMG